MKAGWTSGGRSRPSRPVQAGIRRWVPALAAALATWAGGVSAQQHVPSGSIEIVYGTAAVCRMARDELEVHFGAFGKDARNDGHGPDLPLWQDAPTSSPPGWQRGRQAWFDFDNDGNRDAAFSSACETGAADGVALRVHRDAAPPSLQRQDAADGAGDWFLPCARCTTLTPFFFQRETYLAVSSASEDAMDYVAVLKPMPHGHFDQACLLRRVPENF
jgi:hypothetical protein